MTYCKVSNSYVRMGGAEVSHRISEIQLSDLNVTVYVTSSTNPLAPPDVPAAAVPLSTDCIL